MIEWFQENNIGLENYGALLYDFNPMNGIYTELEGTFTSGTGAYLTQLKGIMLLNHSSQMSSPWFGILSQAGLIKNGGN